MNNNIIIKPLSRNIKGYVIENLEKKLAVPDRGSKLPDGLNGHYVVVDKKVHDTNPSNPWKGVAFYRVRHVPEKCQRCKQIATAEKYEKIKESLEKEIPGIKQMSNDQEALDMLPNSASLLLFNMHREENAKKILAHKDWWAKAISVIGRVKEIDVEVETIIRDKWKEVAEAEEVVMKLRNKYHDLTSYYFKKEFEVDGKKFRDEVIMSGDFRTGKMVIFANRELWRKGKRLYDISDDDDMPFRLNRPTYIIDWGWFKYDKIPAKDLPKLWIKENVRKFLKAYKEVKPLQEKMRKLKDEYFKFKEEMETSSDLTKERQKLMDWIKSTNPYQ